MTKRRGSICYRIKNFLRATRISRSSYAIISILTASSFVNIINKKIIAFIVLAIMFYTLGGLQNSIKDNDYDIDKGLYRFTVVLILIIGFFISLIDLKILLILPMILVLTYFYNTLSRKIIFSDVITTALTHMFIPFIGALWILNVNIFDYLNYSFVPMSTYFFFINVKNLVGYEEDKKRGYMTPMTVFKDGKIFLLISVILGFILLMFDTYGLNIYPKNILLGLLVILSTLVLIKTVNDYDGLKSLKIARFILVIVLFGYIINNNTIFPIIALFTLFSGLFIFEGIVTIINEAKVIKCIQPWR